jgi:hypothetical protein
MIQKTNQNSYAHSGIHNSPTGPTSPYEGDVVPRAYNWEALFLSRMAQFRFLTALSPYNNYYQKLYQ